MSIKDWSVLVVEDEADSMELVQEILQYYGITCFGAATAEDAIDILNGSIPTLIIIDLALPKMNGWELLQYIQGQPATMDVPCVAITAYHTPDVANKAIEAGFSAYFAKPIDATAFVRELEVVVNESTETS